jgi:DNA-binding MarR family transcriptional regulator
MTYSTLQHERLTGRSLPSAEEEAFVQLVRTCSLLKQPFDRLFGAFGLTAALYNVLRIVRGSEPDGIPCGEVAGRLVSPGPDVTRLADRLVDQGLLTRQRPASDRRVVLLRLTDAGRRRLAEIDEPLAELHRRQLGHLSADELATLSRLLEKARQRPAGGGDLDDESEPAR